MYCINRGTEIKDEAAFCHKCGILGAVCIVGVAAAVLFFFLGRNASQDVYGNYASNALSRANVHVLIYHADGLAGEYTVPVGQSGAGWEIAGDKGVWSEKEDAMLLGTLQADRSDLRQLMEGAERFFGIETYEFDELPLAGLLRFTWTDLEHFSVERVDADTWKVRAYNVYTWDEELSVILNRVCFTVIRTPGSCFDDYRLAGFEIEEEADTGWMRAYYDYLTTDPEGIGFMDNMKEVSGNSRLIYVDDDMIPEIYLNGAGDWHSDILLFLSNGKVEYEVIGMTDGGIAYIPYTGILNGHVGMGSGIDITYKLENGNCAEIGHDGYGSFILNGIEVTEEQYRQTIDSYIGNRGLRQCVPYSLGSDHISRLMWLIRQLLHS